MLNNILSSAIKKKRGRLKDDLFLFMSKARLELARALRPLEPESSASANSATPTFEFIIPQNLSIVKKYYKKTKNR